MHNRIRTSDLPFLGLALLPCVCLALLAALLVAFGPGATGNPYAPAQSAAWHTHRFVLAPHASEPVGRARALRCSTPGHADWPLVRVHDGLACGPLVLSHGTLLNGSGVRVLVVLDAPGNGID